MSEKYSEINEMQVEVGKNVVKKLGVKSGEKVLDMGCGTGEITEFIANLVGKQVEVVGVDPDKERIKVIVQKHRGVKTNTKFIVGDSSSHFPHFNQEHYDIHYSNYVFHWLTAQEKYIFLKTAFNCLKPGGRIVIYCQEENPEICDKAPELLPDDEIENNRGPYKLVKKSVTESLVKKLGYVILTSDHVTFKYTMPSLDYVFCWVCTSLFIDERKVLQNKKEEFARKFVKKDGTIDLDFTDYLIIARKPNYCWLLNNF